MEEIASKTSAFKTSIHLSI